MPTIRVRAARDDEYAAWLPLWRGYQAFSKMDLADKPRVVQYRKAI